MVVTAHFIDDDWKRGAVGHSAVEREQVGRGHLLLVIVWRADQGRVVAEFSRIFGETKGFNG